MSITESTYQNIVCSRRKSLSKYLSSYVVNLIPTQFKYIGDTWANDNEPTWKNTRSSDFRYYGLSLPVIAFIFPLVDPMEVKHLQHWFKQVVLVVNDWTYNSVVITVYALGATYIKPLYDTLEKLSTTIPLTGNYGVIISLPNHSLVMK